jgi:hypothetical protein
MYIAHQLDADLISASLSVHPRVIGDFTGRVYGGRLDLVSEDSSHNIGNVGCLAGHSGPINP